VREHYQRKFQFILVDEYQDTNQLQCQLIDLLAARHQNLMVVGDDAQSIYGWRGAEYRNIIEFPRRYPKTTIFKIETNYRSTPEILALANAAIARNQFQFHKELTAASPPGDKPVVVACADANQQASFVGQRIAELHDEGIPMAQIAVLYRSHFHAMELQLELARHGIPFTISSGIRVFEQVHMKDATAYLKQVYNPRDEPSFRRLAQMLPGVGAKAADKLWLQYAALLSAYPAVSTAFRHCTPVVPKKAAGPWAQLVETLAQIEAPDIRNQPARMLRLVVEAGYDDYLKENFLNYRNRMEDLEALAIFSSQFTGLEDFLTQLSLLTNLETENETPAKDNEDKVRLSTVHQAKGLEWDAVFVIMLCENLFPSERSIASEDGEEEERRLFYVAVTRARRQLYLCHPAVRYTHGYSGDMDLLPSRFLNDLPEETYDTWNLKTF
jgi:DNA helicase II / ATP-dependent DNA helicase PcrA